MSSRIDSQNNVTQVLRDRASLTEKNELLTEQVQKNIETIITLQAQQTQSIPVHNRLLERIAVTFGQPQFLYLQLFLIATWAVYSYLVSQGALVGGFPQLSFADQGIDIASLLISTGVLIYQTRQEKLTEQQSHLMLQIDLLTEQKIAKLIGLVEELRADLPNVRDRHDWEAKLMQQATDPQVILEVLQENLESAAAIAETASDRIKEITD
jgi:uncharacterized membrane protein